MNYSLDFRKQVFKIKDKYDLSLRETGERFNVPVRTLQRWKARIVPKTQRNKPATKIDIEALRKHVKDYPDAYQCLVLK
jgi:transposase